MIGEWIDSRATWSRHALGFFCGVASNLAFEPFGIYPLIFITLSALFFIWRSSRAGSCATTGFLFGLGLYIPGVSWLFISVHEFGEAPMLFAAAVVVALAAVLSCGLALVGALQSLFKVSPAVRLLTVMPAVWVLFEWVRSWLFSGFPWLYVGYSQTDSYLVGWASVFGVLGVSYAVCVIAAILARFYTAGMNIRLALPGILLVVGGFALVNPPWIQTAEPIKAAMLQGDVDIKDKWDVRQARKHLEFYFSNSQRFTDVDLVVWPEIALPYTDKRLEKLRLWDRLRTLPPDFIVGVLEEDETAGTVRYYNSAYGISDTVQKYRKQRLVPFGEYTPFRSLLQWLDHLVVIPASDFDAYSQRQSPIKVAGQIVGVSICYEDAFPTDMLGMLPEAGMLVNISEDAWFGRNLAPAQRLQMSRMRAVESARPVLRTANQGLSASIDHRGNVTDILTQDQGTVLIATVYPASGTNPFVLFGNYPIVLICLISLAALWAAIVRRSSGSNQHQSGES